MKKIINIALAAAICLLSAGCVITLPNIFGGPSLVLTGNTQADAASWSAFSASVRAGIANDEAKAQAFFLANCPAVTDAAVKVASTPASDITAATGGLITVTAAQNQLNNASKALSVATNICTAGTSSSWVTAVQNVATAFKTIAGWLK